MPLKPTQAEFHVLLALRDGPRHGYGIMQDVLEITQGTMHLGPGTLYSAIKRLLMAGAIDECPSESDRRRCYRLTRLGKMAASVEARRLLNLVNVARRRGLIETA
jgi:DNA-binding PadR family transcriptional regulator